jgi:predicted DNA-binding transcriptional regulator YafY
VENEEYFECIVDLKARFDEIIGVTLYQDKELEDIYFAVSPASLDYIRTKWLHTTQIELDDETQEYFRNKYPSLKDHTFFSIECRENPELYAKFASYMGDVSLVEPEYMRACVVDRVRNAAQKYGVI